MTDVLITPKESKHFTLQQVFTVVAAVVAGMLAFITFVFSIHSWGVNTQLDLLKEIVAQRSVMSQERVAHATELLADAARRDSISQVARAALVAQMTDYRKREASYQQRVQELLAEVTLSERARRTLSQALAESRRNLVNLRPAGIDTSSIPPVMIQGLTVTQ